mgnify:CR=1 FL=1
MEQNHNNKIEIKDKLFFFYKKNKIKIYFFIIAIVILIISSIFIETNNIKKNNLISEKYIQAGLHLSAQKKNKAKDLYVEIILSKNKFYSILSLNTILEKNLINDESLILKYFEIVEEIQNSEEQRDLIIFKKALYLLKNSNSIKGNELLEDISTRNPKLKLLIKEILSR